MSAEDLPIDPVSGVEERPQNRREWSGIARSLLLPLLIVAAIVGSIYYLDQRGGSGGNKDGFGTIALPEVLNTTGRSASSDVGRAAPDFLLETPDGGQFRLSDMRGKPVLINFWASWCAPCRQEMPEIVKAQAAHPGLGLVGVNLQENESQIRSFADDFGMKFPIVIDRNGGVGDTWRIGGPVQGIPSSYFIDADGIVRAREFGPMTADTIARDLATIGVQGG